MFKILGDDFVAWLLVQWVGMLVILASEKPVGKPSLCEHDT